MVAGCFVKASDEMRAARTGRARAHAQPTGQLGLPCSGKCCSLLMPDADPLDLAAANGVAQRVQGVTDQAEDLPNSDLFEHANQDVCYHLGHLPLLRCCDGRYRPRLRLAAFANPIYAKLGETPVMPCGAL